MSKMRRIDRVFQARPTLEGAGVHLKRVFGHNEVPTFEHKVEKGHTVFAYVLEGEGYFDPDKEKVVPRENLVLYSDGENVAIDETVAWYGPIVMNTEEELKQAFQEYRNGIFIKD